MIGENVIESAEIIVLDDLVTNPGLEGNAIAVNIVETFFVG
jgi:hypothetical protein